VADAKNKDASAALSMAKAEGQQLDNQITAAQFGMQAAGMLQPPAPMVGPDPMGGPMGMPDPNTPPDPFAGAGGQPY
jgi:hypothetical protein